MMLCRETENPRSAPDCLRVQKKFAPASSGQTGTAPSAANRKRWKGNFAHGLSEDARIFIIEDIEKATLTAANSLLKFTEELDGDKFGIMLTENVNQVLDNPFPRADRFL